MVIHLIQQTNFGKCGSTFGHPVGLRFGGAPVFKVLFGVGQIQGKKAEKKSFVIQKLPLFRRKMVGKGLESIFCFLPFIEIPFLAIETQHGKCDGQPCLPEITPWQILKFLFLRVDLAVRGRISILKWPVLFEAFFAELGKIIENRQQTSFKPPGQFESVLDIQSSG